MYPASGLVGEYIMSGQQNISTLCYAGETRKKIHAHNK